MSSRSSRPPDPYSIANALAFLALGTAVVAVLGWMLGIPSWTRWVPDLPRMVPTTALSVTLAAVSAFSAVRARRGSFASRGVTVAAAIVALLVAGATLLAYASGSAFGPEHLFLYGRTEVMHTAHPGRMSPQTAAALACVAMALLVSTAERPRHRVAQVFGTATAILAVVALGGHVHGVATLFGISHVIGVALPTAIALLALSGAVAALSPEVGLWPLLTREGPGGRYARHLLLASATIPIGAAVVLRGGEALGWYDASFRSGAYVGAMTSLLVAASLIATRAFQQAEDQRAHVMRERLAREATEAASRELREREERLTVTLRSIGDAVIATDEAGRVTILNRVAEELTGWTSDAAVGRPILEVFNIINEQTRLAAVNPVDRVLREGVVLGLANHTALVARDGSERPIADSAAPIRDADGRVSGAVLVFRDQTEERRAAEAVRRSEEAARARAAQLQAVLDCIGDGVLVYDREGRIVRSTPAADRLLELSQEVRGEPVLQRVSRQYEILDEDGQRVAPENMVAVRAAVRGETVRGAVQQVRSGGAEPRWLLISGTPLVVDGVQTGAVLSMTDLTARKRAEEELAVATRLYAVLSRVNEAIVRIRDETALLEAVCRIVAEDGRFPLVWVGLVHGHEVRPAASWGSASEYLGSIRVEVHGELGRGPTGTAVREDRSVINDDFSVNQATAPWRAAATRHGLSASAAFPLHRGRQVIGALTLYATRAGAFTADQVKLLEALCADVSYALDALDHERRRDAAEEALRESERRLREADRRKDEFLSMLSHELRNPLAPIRNSVFILGRAESGSAQAQRARAIIERQAEHLTRLVDDLLDVTRIARGKIELRRRCTDLREIVLRASEDFRPLIEERGLEFDVDVPRERAWADVDATRINQVLGNLLHNAAKFSRRGDAVSLVLHAAADRAEILVRDTGPGIDPALLPHVFDAFVQGDRTLARSDGGLGLGLALVKGIVMLHGGKVSAESAGTGMGASFRIVLPLVEAPHTAEPLAHASTERARRRQRVLVVDDNADGANTLAEVVEMLGHAAEVAYDGPSAIEKVLSNRPDVVLCDIGLPGMSGYEVARRLRAVASTEMRIIALSGFAQADDVRRAAEAGFDAHLAKPCDSAQIERLLS